MSKKQRNAITPSRSENFPDWYQAVVKEGQLAENSLVRGCMIVLPHGMGIWERIKKEMDDKIIATGVENVYFPLLIPLDMMQKEAEHVEGFAKECAVVTHRRLVQDDKGQLIPDGELTNPYIIRPTSEMLIGEAFSRWIHSHRDLPMKINQWANVMRWEMRPRLFLRTSEFLWQEGHTAHATAEDALATTKEMIEVYREILEDYLAIPVIVGVKSESERFPGADETYTVEAMMQDGKALQAGTSHFLGQNFSKAQDISFLGSDEKETHCWTTSWGVSTRMIGGMIMAHGDDDGMVVPPRIAPHHVSIIPLIKKEEQRELIMAYISKLKNELAKFKVFEQSLRVEIDLTAKKPQDKYWQKVKKGVPFIVEVGPRDVEKEALFVTNRLDRANKGAVSFADFVGRITSQLEQQQKDIFERAKAFRADKTLNISSMEEFEQLFSEGKPDIFVKCFVADNEATQNILKKYKASIRCYAVNDLASDEVGNCIFSGEKNQKLAIIARSY